MIRLGSRGWELYPGAACADCQPYSGLRDAFWARQWLQQFKGDSAAQHEFRRVVSSSGTSWPLHIATTEQVIRWMARLLETGQWHVHAPALPDGAGGGGSSAPEETDLAERVSSLPSLRGSPEPPPSRPQEEGSLPGNADEAAIAAAMKTASLLGVPFCEECARAALKRSQEAANA